MARRSKKKKQNIFITTLIVLIFLCIAYQNEIKEFLTEPLIEPKETYTLENIPEYHGNAYTEINNNKPDFLDEDYTKETFESYSDLDSLNRAGQAFAKVGKETMPTTERGSIGMIKPTGWHTIKYDIVSGKYLYNRCHLIGYQENEVANYIEETNNHVLYRVTPIYKGNNLLASGVQIEASSVEDKCGKICFNVYIYNVQDGITIDYTNGDSHLS